MRAGVLVLVGLIVYCQGQQNPQDVEYNNRWKAVDVSSTASSELSGWIPSQADSTEETVVPQVVKRRRRVRKRKKRPNFDSGEVTEEKRRPQRLDQFNNQWGGLVELDSITRPYHRRRVTPKYKSEDSASGETLSATLTFESNESYDENETYKSSYPKDQSSYPENTSKYSEYRYSSSELEENSQEQLVPKDSYYIIDPKSTETYTDSTESTVKNEDLKSLLKKSGGSLSLSEVLQQKNLSLSDLITGKVNAVSALAGQSQTGLSNVDVVASIGTKSTTNGPSKPRKKLLESYLLETTTERRIFVPSHPKYYTSLDYKPHVNDEAISVWSTSPKTDISSPPSEVTTLKSPKTRYDQETTTIRNRNRYSTPRKLPMTSAKLTKSTKILEAEVTSESFPKVTILPENAFKISIGQLFGINEVLKTQRAPEKNEKTNPSKEETIKEQEGPFKMSIDLNKMLKESSKKAEVVSTTASYIQEKLHNVTAKDEVMEILRDNDSKERLSRILKVRNMTIEDLVELRERGSSQRHLADIFHNSTLEPEPKLEEVHEGKITFRQSKSFLQSTTQKPTTSQPIEGDIITETRKETLSATSFPTYQIKLDSNANQRPFQVPVWKTVYPSGIASSSSGVREDIYENIPNVEDFVENQISDAVNGHLNIDVDEERLIDNEEPLFNLPEGVKSAVLASLAIVGSSLVIFLTILVIFRWSQKTKRRFCYRGTLNCSKIKSPILNDTPRRSIRTFMVETLGRKTYKAKQSMSDSIWDSMDHRKPFQ